MRGHAVFQASIHEPTEAIITQVAGQIYAAYISTGKVIEGSEAEWMTRSIREALRIARTVDDRVHGALQRAPGS
ncbi:MAG: hypothetical protein HUJ26_20060 [Planctomycetaceae bacterium]|nr:hypothetical protein [Planctomycetaceae bacterium]